MIHIVVAQRISSWAWTDSNISDMKQHRGKLHKAHVFSPSKHAALKNPIYASWKRLLPHKHCSRAWQV